MATYEIMRISPTTQKLIQRETRHHLDAARRCAHRILSQMDISDARAQYVTSVAIGLWDGSSELVALVGDTELHLYRA